jgi:hypothetical protein
VEADRVALDGFLGAPVNKFGTTAFLKVKNGDPDQFVDRLRAEFETSVVPGRYFEMPSHFRIGMGVDSEMFAEGLRRIGRCGALPGP